METPSPFKPLAKRNLGASIVASSVRQGARTVSKLYENAIILCKS